MSDEPVTSTLLAILFAYLVGAGVWLPIQYSMLSEDESKCEREYDVYDCETVWKPVVKEEPVK